MMIATHTAAPSSFTFSFFLQTRGPLGQKGAVKPLVRLLTDNSHPEEAELAVRALSRLCGAGGEANAELVKQTRWAVESVRELAAKGGGKAPGAADARRLLRQLGEPAPGSPGRALGKSFNAWN